MASEETDEQAAVFGDEFVADEILARLPARCAARCTVLSKHFRQLLVSPHFWLRHRSLGAPLELPHAARIQLHRHHDDREACYFQFHVVGCTFTMEHAVRVDDWTFHASTCNGLVLVSGYSFRDEGQSSINGIVFNPATKEEARLSLKLPPHPGNKEDLSHHILGFGYGPSSKVYKALISEEWSFDEQGLQGCTRLMVASLDPNRDDSHQEQPRTAFTFGDFMDCRYSLHTADDGKVYFLMYVRILFEDWEHPSPASVLAFDVDSEAVTRDGPPEGQVISTSMMLEVRGRPCICTQKGRSRDTDTVLWVLSTDHRWEKLYILVKESSRWDDLLLGAWDCGGGFLFAEFTTSGAYMYNLDEATEEDREGGTTRLAAVSRSMKVEYKHTRFSPKNLWDYQPTLISPASILDNAALLGSVRESVAPKHELDGTFLEMTQMWVRDPMMHMLTTVLHPPPPG